jgi:hypothetical protein
MQQIYQRIRRYQNQAQFQIYIISIICFCCPGLFNALTSFASGIADPTIAYNGNAIIYSVFSLSGLISSGLVNMIGGKISVLVGSFGYVIYALSLYYMSQSLGDDDNEKYSSKTISIYYGSCCILGICAGLLWTAQGQICMTYPTEETKGTYLSIFWIIFNLGAMLGGILVFGVNYENSSDQTESTSPLTYLTFVSCMSFGTMISFLLSSPQYVIRADGSHVIAVTQHYDWLHEAYEVIKIFYDRKMLLLLPIFAYSNWFYTYHSFYNVILFNPRTSGLTSACYWGSQMIGAYIIGKWLDQSNSKPNYSHVNEARLGLPIDSETESEPELEQISEKLGQQRKELSSIFILSVLINVMWAVGLIAQLSYHLQYDHKHNIDYENIIVFFPPLSLYCFYGFNDSITQVWAYWFMSQLSDDLHVLGRYAGYFKAVQSGMAAISWAIGGFKINPLIQLLINWALAMVGLLLAYYSVKVKQSQESMKPYQEFITQSDHLFAPSTKSLLTSDELVDQDKVA